MHWPPPELRQFLTLNLDVFDVLRVFRWFNWLNHFIERKRDTLIISRIDTNFLRRAIKVSGRTTPLLPFPTIHWQLHCVAIFTFECFVYVEQCLNVVLTGRNVCQRPPWISECIFINLDRRPNFHPSTSTPKTCCVFRSSLI